jgi:hypothetical protein
MHIIKFYVCVLTTLMINFFFFLSMWIFHFLEALYFLRMMFYYSFISFCLVQSIFYTSKYIVYEVLEISFICIVSMYIDTWMKEKEEKVVFILICRFFFSSILITRNTNNFYYLCPCLSQDSRTYTSIPMKEVI